MKNATTITANVGGKDIHIETGALAGQADAAVMLTLGETMLHCAISTSREPRPGIDFFPLQVEYREKFYAAGQFPGGYLKREARPSEKEVLTMRVTDRPIRPLFPKGFHRDVQINCLLLSADGENDSDILAMNAASIALHISELPFNGPLAACRVGRVEGEFVVNPTQSQILESDLNLVYAGTREKTMMIEGEADEISEADLIAAMRLAHESIQPIIDAHHELRTKLGLADKVPFEKPDHSGMFNKMIEFRGKELAAALLTPGKKARGKKVREIREEIHAKFIEDDPELDENDFFHVFDDVEIELVRRNFLDDGKRIDGRGALDLRPLTSEVGFLPRVHGSAMFARGETQNVATITLGTKKDSQRMDGVVGGPKEKFFILHYNFPPYSVGEAGRLGATSRREIGHGNLAERSLARMMPEDFEYTVRIVSEIMSSNGSTSMASVCGGTLALLDAGVAIKPVAGISVGLFTRPADNLSKLVIDILGTEDHCGDMDFKVCGTRDGITGWQVDMKINGLDWNQVEEAFSIAYDGRMKILDHMTETLPAPREDYSKYAPRMTVVMIDPEKIGALIGPGGKNIRAITEENDVQIDIADDGSVTIYATNGTAMDAGIAAVKACTAEAEVGVIYDGVVTGTKPFGAFVEVLPGIEGLVHISELADYRVEQTEDICKKGDKMRVKCIDVDEKGKVRLSRKAAIAEEGEPGGDGDAECADDEGGSEEE